MAHFASAEFWAAYERLPPDIRQLAARNFTLLKSDPRHPSLHFKKIGKYWSVRIGLHYRALATEVGADLRWHWIGSHSEYNRLTR
jgi:hypothetical protein